MKCYTLIEQSNSRIKSTPLTATQARLMRRQYQKDAWDKAHLITVSTRLTHEEASVFRLRCLERDVTPYERLRALIIHDTR